MTSKIFSVATFIVVSWMAVTVITTSHHVRALESNVLNGMMATASAMDVRLSKLESAQRKNHLALLAKFEEITKPAAAAAIPAPTASSAINNDLTTETRTPEQQLAIQAEFADLRKAYQDVIESEREKHSSLLDAAATLLSTKSAIWETSTKYPDVKTSLQELMAPIDSVAAQWQSGDINGTVQPVILVLKQTLAALDANI